MPELGSYEHIYSADDAENSNTYWYRVTYFHREKSDNWLYVPLWHEHFEMKLILSGSVEIFCGTELFVASAGDVVIINPYEPHGMRLCNDEELNYYLLMLSPDFPFSPSLAVRYSELFEGKLSFKRLLSQCKEVNDAFSALFDELIDQPPEYELRAESYIALLYTALLRHAKSEGNPEGEISNLKEYGERVRPAINHIYFHYMENISVPELAKLCAMSVYHFCRVFKNVIGSSPVAYINAIRLNKAALLLTTTKLTVGEIAASVGFPDVFYFSKRFKAEKGMSPTEYRSRKSHA